MGIKMIYFLEIIATITVSLEIDLATFETIDL